MMMISDSSSSDDDEEGPGMAQREYQARVNFALTGEEFRQRYRLSTEAAEWLIGRIGPYLSPPRGDGVRTVDISAKQKMLITLKFVLCIQIMYYTISV
jgi:hypothetical protein